MGEFYETVLKSNSNLIIDFNLLDLLFNTHIMFRELVLFHLQQNKVNFRRKPAFIKKTNSVMTGKQPF